MTIAASALPRATIVMYHYVRPLLRTRFPEIKGLDVDGFRGQLSYLKRHYNIIGMDDLIDAAAAGSVLPPRACLLSFDDGLSDHFQYVFPILHDEGIQGCFYPPRATLLDRELLDVNKIHFVLASVAEKERIEAALDEILLADEGYDDAGIAELKRQYRIADHLDTASTVYVKHLLQYALPEALRHRVVDRLFARFVSADASTFAEELYLTKDQARTMIACGMHFGGHGDQHYWLSRIPAAQQGAEIDRATQMLLGIGMPRDRLTFCYPYGDYDAASVDLLAAKGYRAALTTKSGIADLARGSMLELPRLDTIDLPRVADAEVNGWTVWA